MIYGHYRSIFNHCDIIEMLMIINTVDEFTIKCNKAYLQHAKERQHTSINLQLG